MINKRFVAIAIMAGPALAHASVLPELPIAFKYGTGAIDNNQTIYVGLGTAGKSWFKLNTRQAKHKWLPIADFPGAERDQATSVLLNGHIYVFGGTGKNEQGETQVLHDIYRYDPDTNIWKKLMTHSPEGLVGNVAFTHEGQAIIMGGVNENIFNGYFEDIAAAQNNSPLQKTITQNYFNKPVKDYFYNRHILSFNPVSQQWSNIGDFPYAGTAGSTVVVKGDQIVLINGEVKPGLRTSATYRGEIKNSQIHWTPAAPVAVPDGVAGGFGGTSEGAVLFAGGANFPGSAANYAKGNYYAHDGLKKHYSTGVYALKDNTWREVGELPQGLAYGVSVPWQGGVLLIGGETTGGAAVSASTLLKMDEGKLIVSH